MIEGIDVSRYQNPADFDWTVVAKSNAFLYAKATDGVGSPDKRFDLHVAAARSVGMKTGAYHYLHPRHGRPQDGVDQANAFCDAIERVQSELIPMMDCETDGNEAATDAEWLEVMRQFLARCEERLGVKPFIYTYPGFWGSRKGLVAATDLAEYPLWIAHYTAGPAPIVPKPWKTWTAWQFAAGAGNIGRIPGYSKMIDRNRLKVSLESISMNGQCPPVVKPTIPDFDDVEVLQASLQRLGYDPGPVDGKMGAKTKAAVQAFQKANNLTPDGVVGPKTKLKLADAWATA